MAKRTIEIVMFKSITIGVSIIVWLLASILFILLIKLIWGLV